MGSPALSIWRYSAKIRKQCDGECPCEANPACEEEKPLPDGPRAQSISDACLKMCPAIFSPLCGRLVDPDRKTNNKGACLTYDNKCMREVYECEAQLKSPRAFIEDCNSCVLTNVMPTTHIDPPMPSSVKLDLPTRPT